MTIKIETVAGYARPPLPEPEFQVEYVGPRQRPIVVSVTSATGQRLHTERHPRFQEWLQRQLNPSNEPTS